MKFHVEYYSFQELHAVRPAYAEKHRINPDQLYLFEKGSSRFCAVVSQSWIDAYLLKWQIQGKNYRKGERVIVVILADLIVGADRWYGLKKLEYDNFKQVYQRVVSTNTYARIKELSSQTADKHLAGKLNMEVLASDDMPVLQREINRRGKLIGWTLDSIGLKIYRLPGKSSTWVVDCIRLGLVRHPLCGAEVLEGVMDNLEESRIMARYVYQRLISMKSELPGLLKMIHEYT